MSNPSAKLKPIIPTSLSVSLMGLFVMAIPSLNGTGVDLFGWHRWPHKPGFAIVAVGMLLILVGVGLTVRSIRSHRRP